VTVLLSFLSKPKTIESICIHPSLHNMYLRKSQYGFWDNKEIKKPPINRGGFGLA